MDELIETDEMVIGCGIAGSVTALQLADAVPLAVQDTVEADAQGCEETVLVVEDDEAIRQALAEILESLNYRVLLASDGQEGSLTCLIPVAAEVSILSIRCSRSSLRCGKLNKFPFFLSGS